MSEIYWVVCLKTTIVLLVVFIAFRLGGKRLMSQFNVYDLVTLIALANAVQNAMTMGRGELGIGISAATTLILSSWLLGRVFVLRPNLEKHVIGVPTVVIYNGHVRSRNMRKEGITRSELMASLRSHGLTSPKQVKWAVLEVDGEIGVVPKEHPSQEDAKNSSRRV